MRAIPVRTGAMAVRTCRMTTPARAMAAWVPGAVLSLKPLQPSTQTNILPLLSEKVNCSPRLNEEDASWGPQ
jgi:hypothetical protein